MWCILEQQQSYIHTCMYTMYQLIGRNGEWKWYALVNKHTLKTYA